MIVGAYAAMPTSRAEQEAFLSAIADFATGLEIPWRAGALDADPGWLATQLAGRFPDCVVTAIPDTMRMQGQNPDFGLASPNDAGRAAALAQAREIFAAIATHNANAGQPVVTRVELHSAPSHTADVDALVASLTELAPEAERAALLAERDLLAGLMCSGAGGGREDYRGVKIQVPAGADVQTRVAMIRRLAAMC